MFVCVYNYCRIHSALRVTPAMQAGLTDHVWSVAELIEAAFALVNESAGDAPPPIPAPVPALPAPAPKAPVAAMPPKPSPVTPASEGPRRPEQLPLPGALEQQPMRPALHAGYWQPGVGLVSPTDPALDFRWMW